MSRLILAALLTLCGCKTRPDPAYVQRVVLSLPPALDEDSTAREALRTQIYEQLKVDELTRVVKSSARATHVVGVEVVSSLPASLAATPGDRGVIVRLSPLDHGPPIEAVGYGDYRARGWVFEAFQDAWSVVTTHRTLRVAPERDVLAALDSNDPRVRYTAMGLIGERKIVAGVDRLCRILETESQESLLLRTVGALIALSDPRAIDPLIKLTRHKSPAFVLQIVFAVGAIGGQTARGYLVTLASGHPLESVRRGARDALDELKRRESNSKSAR